MMTRLLSRAIAGAILLAALAVAGAFVGSGVWNWAVAALFVAGFWLSVLRTRSEAVSGLGLLALTGLGLMGVYRQASPLLLLTGMTAGLAAWDLVHFRNEVESTDDRRDEDVLVGNHLRRLAIVLAAGWAAGFLALVVRVHLSLIWALLLGVAGIYGLSRTIQAARR
ncbi:MAG: hypothetical protein D6790_21160 [Caldilineae bacterium]|nr:MAG: hypothetical protein D6790_21160 [Caldilineae bacterium]